MEPLEIGRRIEEAFPGQVLEIVEHRGQVGVVVQRDQLLEICRWLHDEPEFQMNHLLSLCGVDYQAAHNCFEVVYNLYSIPLRHQLRLRARVPAEDCRIDSVTSLWPGANWLERECYDLMGVVFRGHPDLRRILLPEDWEGHPLRKDYPVRLPESREWQGMVELKQLAAELRQYDFQADPGGDQSSEQAVEENHGKR